MFGLHTYIIHVSAAIADIIAERSSVLSLATGIRLNPKPKDSACPLQTRYEGSAVMIFPLIEETSKETSPRNSEEPAPNKIFYIPTPQNSANCFFKFAN